jgi:hypothetical protein
MMNDVVKGGVKVICVLLGQIHILIIVRIKSNEGDTISTRNDFVLITRTHMVAYLS